MEHRELEQSFDPRTWTSETGEDCGKKSARSRPGRAPETSPRPPFALAALAAVGIFSVGAAAAFVTRADVPAETQIAAGLETSGGAAEDGAAGASLAGDQP